MVNNLKVSNQTLVRLDNHYEKEERIYLSATKPKLIPSPNITLNYLLPKSKLNHGLLNLKPNPKWNLRLNINSSFLIPSDWSGVGTWQYFV